MFGLSKIQLFRMLAPKIVTEISCYVTATDKLRDLCEKHLGTTDPNVICDILINIFEQFLNEEEE